MPSFGFFVVSVRKNWANSFPFEIVKLLEVGFEWVGKDNDGLTYFRKRK